MILGQKPVRITSGLSFAMSMPKPNHLILQKLISHWSGPPEIFAILGQRLVPKNYTNYKYMFLNKFKAIF
jgi:hypothetical protein